MHKHKFTHWLAIKQFINAKLGPCTEWCSHGYQMIDESDFTYCLMQVWKKEWNYHIQSFKLLLLFSYVDQIFIFSMKQISNISGMTKTSNLNSLWRFPHHTFLNRGLFGCLIFLWNEALQQLLWVTEVISMNVIHIKLNLRVPTHPQFTVLNISNLISQIPFHI